MDVNMVARGDGAHARGPTSRFPFRSAFRGPFPPGSLWWFARVNIIELALGKGGLARSRLLHRAGSTLEKVVSQHD